MPEYYLGIDVGYSKDKCTTGLCVLTLDQNHLRWSRCHNTGSEQVERRRSLLELVPRDASLAGVGIDGPLVRNLKIVDRYRSADALLSRNLFQRRGKPGPSNSPSGKDLHSHATQLGNLVIRLQTEGYLSLQDATHPYSIHQTRLLEVFPTSFLSVLLSDADHATVGEQFPQQKVPRGKRSDEFWKKAVREGYLERLIERLAPQACLCEPLEDIKNHDHRAAFICALAALCVARNQYMAVGDPNDGHIFLPPILQPWAEDAIRENLGSVRTLSKHLNHDKAQVIQNGTPWDYQALI